jgi:hypothetical protein
LDRNSGFAVVIPAVAGIEQQPQIGAELREPVLVKSRSFLIATLGAKQSPQIDHIVDLGVDCEQPAVLLLGDRPALCSVGFPGFLANVV